LRIFYALHQAGFPFDGLDNVAKRYRFGRPGQRITAARSPDGTDKACFAKRNDDQAEIFFRNILACGDILEKNGFILRRARQGDHQPNAVARPCREFHVHIP
jgi:hypothetical protein